MDNVIVIEFKLSEIDGGGALDTLLVEALLKRRYGYEHGGISTGAVCAIREVIKKEAFDIVKQVMSRE